MEPTLTRSRWPLAVLLALVLIALLRSWAGTRLDSFTIDEPWHAVAGVVYAQRGDYAINPEHPPLVKRWVGAWLGDLLQVPPVPVLTEKRHEREFVETTMYRDNDDRAVQARTRGAMWTFNALLLAGIALLLWRQFGVAWAIGSIAFLAIEPTVGAHLPVVMTDLPVAATLTLAALATGLVLSTWRWHASLLLAFALGLALGSKHSALSGLIGLALFALLGWLWQARRVALREALRRLAQLALAGLLAVGLLWAQYDFRFHARPDGSDGFNRETAAKIDDLRSTSLKRLLHLADAHRLLPRAYLWGLADTARVGLEGRGEPGTIQWGRFIAGPPPWFTWPGFIAAKLPLALLVMALAGAIALWRARLPASARWPLGAMLAMGASCLVSLVNAQSAYAGVRHAMPLVFVLAICAGALAWRASSLPRRAWRMLPAGLLLLAAGMTWREPRLWEYHNELVGGTAGAYRWFSNESVELGQRLHEIEAFHAREIAAGGEPLYVDYWAYITEGYAESRSMRMRRRVESVHDDNVAGVFEGWFIKEAAARLPMPSHDYDPVEALAGLAAVQRIGNVEIWHGRQLRPRSRDWPIYNHVVEYVYSDGGDDWALVAAQLREIVRHRPQLYGAALELGNAYLKLGERELARGAYAGPLAQDLLPVPAALRAQMQARIDALDAGTALAEIEPIRNPMLE